MPKTSSSVIILRLNDEERIEVLVGSRGREPRKGELALPGGHCSPGEDPHDAACRELREETGVEMGRLLKVTDRAMEDEDGREFVYLGVVMGGAPEPVGGSDFEDPRWVLLDEMPELAWGQDELVCDAICGVWGREWLPEGARADYPNEALREAARRYRRAVSRSRPSKPGGIA